MAWGRGASGSGSQIDDWLRKLKANDPTLANLYILNFRKLSGEEYRRLFAALHDNVSLKAFHSGHAIGGDELAALAEALSRNKGLESLSVGDRTFGDEGVAVLCDGLRGNGCLVKLDLENKGLGLEGCQALGSLLGHHPALCELALGRNALQDACVEALLHDGAAVLSKLDFFGNSLGEGSGRTLGQWLASCSVEELNLMDNEGFDDKAACLLAEGLQANTSLRVLGLGGCPIGNLGFAAIAAALHQSECDVELTLNVDKCGLDAGCKEGLEELLTPGGRPVTQLLVSNNDIGADGVAAIARMVVGNTTLRVLDVAENKLDAAAIGQLQQAPGLRVLRLFNNKLGDEGISVLCEAVGLTALEEIDLNGTGITDEGIQALCGKLRTDPHFWPSIASIEVGGNSVSDRGVWERECKTAREGVRIVWGEGRQQNMGPNSQ